MNENEAKGLCMALLFVDTLIFGWPPYLLVRGGQQSARSVRIRTQVISYLTCFAGGVFLGACLLHLLAEGRETMEDYFKSGNSTDPDGSVPDFPIYESVVAGGFFAIAMVEQIAHGLLHKSGRFHQSEKGDSGKDLKKSLPATPSAKHKQISTTTFSEVCSAKHKQISTTTFSEDSDKPTSPTEHLHHHSHHHHPHHQQNGVANLAFDTPPSGRQESKNGLASPGQAGYGTVHPDMPTDRSQPKELSAKGVLNGSVDLTHYTELVARVNQKSPDEDCESTHREEIFQILDIMEVNPLRAFLLLGALSFHTIFDGLAVGIQDGNSSDIWEVFAAICIHKSLVAICLGLQLFLAFKSKPLWGFVWVFIFSLISPIGLGIGMILTSGNVDEDAEQLADWVLQALATGTFLYVTMFEILYEEFLLRGNVFKILVTMVGFGGMAVAKILDTD